MLDRKSTRLNSSHLVISYAVFCLKKKKQQSPAAGRPGAKRRLRTGARTDGAAAGLEAAGQYVPAGQLGQWVQLKQFFFFNDTATTEIYTLSLHDALPI